MSKYLFLKDDIRTALQIYSSKKGIYSENKGAGYKRKVLHVQTQIQRIFASHFTPSGHVVHLGRIIKGANGEAICPKSVRVWCKNLFILIRQKVFRTLARSSMFAHNVFVAWLHKCFENISGWVKDLKRMKKNGSETLLYSCFNGKVLPLHPEIYYFYGICQYAEQMYRNESEPCYQWSTIALRLLDFIEIECVAKKACLCLLPENAEVCKHSYTAFQIIASSARSVSSGAHLCSRSYLDINHPQDMNEHRSIDPFSEGETKVYVDLIRSTIHSLRIVREEIKKAKTVPREYCTRFMQPLPECERLKVIEQYLIASKLQYTRNFSYVLEFLTQRAIRR